MQRLGVLVNPDAGLGGRLGFKGSDGRAEEARLAGAQERGGPRMRSALEMLLERLGATRSDSLELVIAAGRLGEDWLEGLDMDSHEIIGEWPGPTSAADTRDAVSMLAAMGIDLLLYSGGDGTTRDIVESLEAAGRTDLPIIGVPSGVKMHSGCFAESPRAAAEVIDSWLRGELGMAPTEVLDLDEGLYREGQWRIAMYGEARTPAAPRWMQGTKQAVRAPGEEEFVEGISQHVKEEFVDPAGRLVIWGSGSTLRDISEACGIETTLLGIDISLGSELLGSDLAESEILSILEEQGQPAVLLLSPMGGQGFLLGRGNLQLSPAVLRRIGVDEILGVATPSKLMGIERIRIDTGDEALDEEIRSAGYVKLLQGYRTTRLMRLG